MRKNYQEMYLRDGKERVHLILLRKPICVQDQSLAGYVSSKLFSENIALVIDRREERTYEYACAAMDNAGHLRVLMEAEVYLDFLRGKPYARATILHELGHIHYNDLPEIEGMQYDTERLCTIESGEVHEREIRADAFAARFLGKETVREGLSFLQEADIAEDEEENGPSIQELSRRIHILGTKG